MRMSLSSSLASDLLVCAGSASEHDRTTWTTAGATTTGRGPIDFHVIEMFDKESQKSSRPGGKSLGGKSLGGKSHYVIAGFAHELKEAPDSDVIDVLFSLSQLYQEIQSRRNLG